MDDISLETNKVLVRRLFEEVIDGGDLALADELLKPDYIQHNPSAGQGIDGFKTYFAELERTKRRLRATSSTRVLSMMAEGDRVFAQTEARFDSFVHLRFEAMDVFRVENGRIAEHWDVIQGRSLLSGLALLILG